MATQAIAASVDKVLTLGFPGMLKGVGMQVYNGHPVFGKLLAKKSETWRGESTQVGIVTSTYDKVESYQNDDPLDTTSREPVTAGQFELGGYQGSVNIPGMKIRKIGTSTPNLMTAQKLETELLMNDFAEKMTTHFFQAANDSKGILSLSTLTDATTTIAGVAGGTTWGGTTTASGAFSTQGLTDLMTLYTGLSVFADLGINRNTTGYQNEPDWCITTRALWQAYWTRLAADMRFSPNGEGDIKFRTLTFMGAPITVDTHVASGVWYVLRKDTLHFPVMDDANFSHIKIPPSQEQPDGWGMAVIWNGQVACNTRRTMGKLTGMS